MRVGRSIETALRQTSIDPEAAPKDPRLSSPLAFLWWLLAVQRWRAVRGTLWGCTWMAVLTLPPYLVARAVDGGLQAGNHRVLVFWVIAIVLTGAVNGWLGIARHRTMSLIRLDATTRTLALVDAKVSRLGARHARRSSTGEVLAIGTSDTARMAQTLTIAGPGVGAVVAVVLIAVLLFRVSVPLALVVLVGVPVVTQLLGVLVRVEQRVDSHYRDLDGELTGRAADIASGVGIIAGVGNTQRIADDFEAQVVDLRQRGYQVAAVTSWVQAATLALPVVFIAIVTWLAARLTAQGSMSIGELLAVYGYVTVLVVPVSQFAEGLGDLARGLVAARRAIDFLSVPEGPDEHLSAPIEGDAPHRHSDARATLFDPTSGLRVAAGSFVAVVATDTDLIDFVDHLSGRAAPAATWDGPPDRDGASPVVVVRHGSMLFPGTLRSVLSTRDHVTDHALSVAVRSAAAEDIVAGLPDGMDTEMSLDAQNVSGGQRQRLLLARALAHDPEVLVLVDPTSAVDSQTEAVMVSGLQTSRAGRTTIVVGTSPVLLDAADSIAFVAHGKVVVEGSHDELLASTPAYRSALSSTGEKEPDDGD